MNLDFKVLAPSDVKMIRRSVVQFLYQFDRLALVTFRPESFFDFCQQVGLPEKLQQVTAEFIQGAIHHLDEHDLWIQEQSRNWTLDRMARVELAILRACLTELRVRVGVKPAIVMADAAEIAKEFGAENSAAFVHGILDSVWKKCLQAAAGPAPEGTSDC